MLFALEEIEKQTTSKNEKSPQLLNVRAPKSPGFARTPQSAPRMPVNMYSKSPLVKKKTAKLMFTDFEAQIRKEHFDQLPSYMRGRITMSELQDFLDNVVIKCFNHKYEILYKNRAFLSTGDFQLQQIFLSQATYFENDYFITLGDLARTQKRNIDKKEEKYLHNLRFLKIIKDIRKNSATCYLWKCSG
jgi:hypothetical protein